MKAIVFREEAALELEAGQLYYDGCRPGLGEAFLAEVEAVVARIQEHPHIGAKYKSTAYRRCLLRRFPYLVFYLDMDDAIRIVAIAHGRRRPGYWMEREKP
jgi:toxin ParE1/3/4